MNREILFKGKRVDNGEWEEGYLFDNGYSVNKRMFVGGLVIDDYEGTACDEYEINGIDFKEVDPKTISQYTGIKDKNSKKIWENDIVKDSRGNLYKVFWQENYYQFAFICIKANDALLFGIKWDLLSLAKNNDLELHGSIFDNPELLKGSEENG